MVTLEDGKADSVVAAIKNVLQNVLQKKELLVDRLYGLGTDGAAVMTDIHPCPGPGVVSIDLTAGGPAVELHTPSVGFRRGWLAEQIAPPAGLCGLALTAADLAAGPLPTPSEDYGSTPRAGGRAAEIHTPPDTTGLASEEAG
ncbi:hypothetical protein NQZ68_015902 [Dissostichus eleginoides]|nr:hypothetical protein NQZ68_015902 [Dissostichus eleginoides]